MHLLQPLAAESTITVVKIFKYYVVTCCQSLFINAAPWLTVNCEEH